MVVMVAVWMGVVAVEMVVALKVVTMEVVMISLVKMVFEFVLHGFGWGVIRDIKHDMLW